MYIAYLYICICILYHTDLQSTIYAILKIKLYIYKITKQDKACYLHVAYFKISITSIVFMYYLINEQECFIGFKTRGEAERFISDKVRTASFLNGFKNLFISGFIRNLSFLLFDFLICYLIKLCLGK